MKFNTNSFKKIMYKDLNLNYIYVILQHEKCDRGKNDRV